MGVAVGACSADLDVDDADHWDVGLALDKARAADEIPTQSTVVAALEGGELGHAHGAVGAALGLGPFIGVRERLEWEHVRENHAILIVRYGLVHVRVFFFFFSDAWQQAHGGPL